MGNRESTATRKFDVENQRPLQLNSIPVRNQRIKNQTVQNILLIWLDCHINDYDIDCRNTLNQLRRVVNEIKTFTDGEECVRFTNKITDNKACIIISGSFGQYIVPQVHDISQVDSIFIFCKNKRYHERWVKRWPKVKGVFTEITPICKALKQVRQQCEQSATSISFVTSGNDDASKKNLDQLDPIFMYTMILKEILLTIRFDHKYMKEFIDHCREIFANNKEELMDVHNLQTKYHQRTPIWWYTCEMFLCSMLNHSLRLMNMEIIMKMGFFITDLHRQIEKLRFKQFGDKYSKNVFVVYRGQGMSKTDFEKMRKTQGGLISFNNFLSTSKKREVSLRFAHNALPNMDMVGILFVMSIDPKKSTTPFACVNEDSYFGDEEDEVLFSMHSIFRIGEIESMDVNQRLFQVNLTLTDDNDKDLRLLTNHIRKETYPDERGWYRLGLLLLKVGESAIALQVYETLLEQTSDIVEKAKIYHELGRAKCNLGEYQEAIIFYEEALAVYRKTLPSTHLSLANSYICMGNAYNAMGNYPSALYYYEKALEIQKQSLPSNHSYIGFSHNNIGLVYSNMGNYSKALSSHEKALEIQKKSLPPNHPDLASSYNNIGLVYQSIGDYSKALSSLEEALEIRKQSLLSNHPDLGASYNNIGMVYFQMHNYPKALSYYEKDLEISKQSLPSNHPELASSYNNIGGVYFNMGDYQKALSFLEEALEIRKQSLPSYHPDLARSYNNIGMVYENMNHYSKARSFYEQAIQIGQQSLLANHPNLQMYKKNLNGVKYKS